MNHESWINLLLFSINVVLAGVGVLLKSQADKRRKEIESLEKDMDLNTAAIQSLRLQLAQDYFHKIETKNTVLEAVQPLAGQLVELKQMVHTLLMRSTNL